MQDFETTDFVGAGSIGISILIFAAALYFIRKKIQSHRDIFIRQILREVRYPVIILFIATVIFFITKIPALNLEDNDTVNAVYPIAAIAILAWLIIKAINLVSLFVLRKYDVTQKDNLSARMMVTKVRILRRLMTSLILILAVAGALMTFESIRALGVSILASAGLAGIVVGFAAQKTIGNFFAGLQIAITQPIRLEDAVLVEGQFGNIEEINLTYVVVRIWDLKRMILPISYFVEEPFQNWTRNSSNILDSVLLYLDYKMPLQPIRDQVDKILEGNSLWDGKVKSVAVTNTTERTMEVRILISAANSGAAFDLRTQIREKMITFIQENYPEGLPQARGETKISELPQTPEQSVP